jgi:nicotinamidase-related amidase
MEGVGCLLIDLQESFLKVVHNRSALEKRLAFVAEACVLLGIKVYLSEQVPEKLGPTIPAIKDLVPDAGVFPKRSFSLWQEETFREQLKNDNVGHLLVGGIETPICVYQTVVQARNDEMQITLLSDCVGARRKGDEQTILHTLNSHGTLCLPSESIFYSVLGDVDHPDFKAFTQLVKRYSD